MLKPSSGQLAQELVVSVLAKAGWSVTPGLASEEADLMIQRGDSSYAVEIKSASEGRGDRLIALWSQAHLQGAKAAGVSRPSLAIVVAPRISKRAADQLLDFAARYAPDAAAGVMDLEGLRRFRGADFEQLNATHDETSIPAHAPRASPKTFFSDMNQWMLKVLLAPELPEALLSAPRARYRNASELARAAVVSVMTAFRFLDHLRREGHIHESRQHLELVRRDVLFRHWHASTMVRPAKELPMRFLLFSGSSTRELRRMTHDGRACAGLFAAAKALRLGFVEGVQPHAYVRRLDHRVIASLENLKPSEKGEGVQLFLRQASAPESVFRGAVQADGMLVTDVLQTWLDVASHPSRGAEQADFILRRALGRVVKGNGDG